MQRILVATDGSEGSDRAVEVSAELAAAGGSELTILHVAGNVPWETMEELRRSTADTTIGEIIDSNTQSILELACNRARKRGAKKVNSMRAWGDAAEKILEVIQNEKVDVLVIGRRGRGRISGLLFGSVSQKVASLAPCIVVVVP